MDEIVISGKRFISSRRAAKEHGYHSDYIGQLIRSGKIIGQKVGHNWYVSEASLEAYIHDKEAEGKDLHDGKKEMSEVQRVSGQSTVDSRSEAATSPEHKEETPSPGKEIASISAISRASNPESKPFEYKMLTYLPEENNTGLEEKTKPAIHASAPARSDGSTPIKLTTIQPPLETNRIPVPTSTAFSVVPKPAVALGASFAAGQMKPLPVAASSAPIQIAPARANFPVAGSLGATRVAQPIHVSNSITLSEGSLLSIPHEKALAARSWWVTAILLLIGILVCCGGFAASLLPSVITVSL